MKQNSQWLSQVRTRSNSAEDTSMPERLARRPCATLDRAARARRAGSRARGRPRRPAAGTRSRRGARGRRWRAARRPRGGRPAAAGDAAATATTRGADMASRLPGRRQPARPRRARCPRAGSLGTVPVERVLLASPRGFCAGVEMAIKALAWMVRVFEPPVYCYHEIVHNQLVVRAVPGPRAWSSSTTSTRSPPARPLMLSAHGSAPEVVAAARGRGAATWSTPCARWSPRSTTS